MTSNTTTQIIVAIAMGVVICSIILFLAKRRPVDPDLNDEKKARLELRKLYFSKATGQDIDKLEAQAQVPTLDDLRLLARGSDKKIAETLREWYHIGALPVWLGRILSQAEHRKNLVPWFRSELRLRIDRARRSES